MSKAIIIRDICPLFGSKDERVLVDEALYGNIVDVGKISDGFATVTTSYHYSGFAPISCLLDDPQMVNTWENVPKYTPKTFFADVLSQPRVQGTWLTSVPRGGQLFIPDPAVDEEGWYKTVLPNGMVGFVRSSSVEPDAAPYTDRPEQLTRKMLVDNARFYLGSQYRWGGKTAYGLDCSGLVSISYLLAGSVIYRDASYREGFDLHEIPFEQLEEGDVIYYPNHVTMYLQNDLYIHSTGHRCSPGVVINSFDPSSPVYRPDLHETHLKCASIFCRPVV